MMSGKANTSVVITTPAKSCPPILGRIITLRYEAIPVDWRSNADNRLHAPIHLNCTFFGPNCELLVDSDDVKQTFIHATIIKKFPPPEEPPLETSTAK